MTRLAARGPGPATTANNGQNNYQSTQIILSNFSFGTPAHTVSAPPPEFLKVIAELPRDAQALLLKVHNGGVVPDAPEKFQTICPEPKVQLAMACLVAARAAWNKSQLEGALLCRLSPENLPPNESQNA
jgi:hypothetical protein